MADVSLGAESALANLSFEMLHAAYRRAKAAWDLAAFAPENVETGMPDEETNAYCRAFADALNAFLLHPASNARELAHKLTVFRDEDIIDNWARGAEIVAVLVDDARRLARLS